MIQPKMIQHLFEILCTKILSYADVILTLGKMAKKEGNMKII